MAENLFMKRAREMGYIDQREVAFAADMACTNGNSGRGWFFLNGSVLTLCSMVGMADFSPAVEVIDLKDAQFVKGSSFVLHSYVKFACGGHTYSLQGFAQAKKVLEAIKSSCG